MICCLVQGAPTTFDSATSATELVQSGLAMNSQMNLPVRVLSASFVYKNDSNINYCHSKVKFRLLFKGSVNQLVAKEYQQLDTKRVFFKGDHVKMEEHNHIEFKGAADPTKCKMLHHSTGRDWTNGMCLYESLFQ